jgi:hypothetical protein
MRGAKNKYMLIIFSVIIGIFSYAFIFTKDKVDYNTEIKPLLNKKCITCHGGVKRKGGFSLLFRQEALDTTESGVHAIVPGRPDESEMIRRLTLTDPDERMPHHEDPLSKKEIELLRQWIREGAVWGDHWAYESVWEPGVPRPEGRLWGFLPAPKNEWVKNEIDWFILDKQKDLALKPSAEADKRILLRRVSLDLTGLPAPEHIAKAYLNDKSEHAYEKLVGILLSLPTYGERWTALWMDLARYADTKGYERDDNRSIWRYRDWLIKSFNEDKPYNQFLTEQIAGDLIPDATDEQLIATAFHRNTLTNDEGGTENEEFRTAAVIDRVNTTWEALMGTTFACVQCHSHPYDPIRHEEYYKFLAFFNNTRDEDTYADYPLLHEFKQVDSIRFDKLKTFLQNNANKEESNRVIHFVKTWQPAVNSLVADSFVNSELADTKWLIMRKESASRIRNIDLSGKKRLIIRYIAWPKDGVLSIRLDSDGGREWTKISLPPTRNGWGFHEVEVPAVPGKHDLHLLYNSKSLKNKDQNGVQFDWFYFTEPFPGKGKPGYDSAYAQFWQLLKGSQADITPILVENPPDLQRQTHIFERGNWLVKGDAVEPDVPHSLNPLPKGAPKNRLGLAQWLTDTKNPLTARTLVNRVWEQLFGQGLAETLDDLGTQGIAPTHPELLDHLSWQFMHADQWSIKKLLKKMVMSATYRQDSKISREALAADPYNHWYARGPRVRLTAEQMRDQALAISGVLSSKMYGPSVMPYQPGGIWLSPWNGQNWEKSTGEDQYRRAIYTYWKRTAPYPSMLSFDGSAREVCVSRRIRTNTPLQALTTLNDSAYFEASRFLAYQLISTNGNDYPKVIRQAYERAVGYPITAQKEAILVKLYTDALDRLKKDKDKTCGMIGVQDEHNNAETAAMVVVMNAIMNLDEVITKN